MPESMTKSFSATVAKVDDQLGIVFGWAIICKRDGAEYFDTQGDHIPEDSMLAAAADFMASARTLKVMHAGEGVGQVLFAFPMTADIAKAIGWAQPSFTGLLVGVKPNDKRLLDKFKDGTLTGFSIGGHRITDEEVSP